MTRSGPGGLAEPHHSCQKKKTTTTMITTTRVRLPPRSLIRQSRTLQHRRRPWCRRPWCLHPRVRSAHPCLSLSFSCFYSRGLNQRETNPRKAGSSEHGQLVHANTRHDATNDKLQRKGLAWVERPGGDRPFIDHAGMPARCSHRPLTGRRFSLLLMVTHRVVDRCALRVGVLFLCVAGEMWGPKGMPFSAPQTCSNIDPHCPTLPYIAPLKCYIPSNCGGQ